MRIKIRAEEHHRRPKQRRLRCSVDATRRRPVPTSLRCRVGSGSRDRLAKTINISPAEDVGELEALTAPADLEGAIFESPVTFSHQVIDLAHATQVE